MTYQLETPELAKALYFALKKDPFYRTMKKTVSSDKQAAKQAMLAYMDYSIQEARIYGESFIPEKLHYGVSVWLKPLEKSREEERRFRKQTFIAQHMGEKSLQVYQEINDFMSEQSKSLVEPDSWYLSIVGILPDFQGQGLGPGLVESVLEKSDEKGAATYLETYTPRNMAFYQRLGYQTLGSFVEPKMQSEYWLMQRPAS